MQVHPAYWLHAGHGTQVAGVAVHQSGRQKTALQELLRRRGMDVKISSITQIVPPPLSKLSVRYQGVDATITLAPDIGD